MGLPVVGGDVGFAVVGLAVVGLSVGLLVGGAALIWSNEQCVNEMTKKPKRSSEHRSEEK